MEVQNNNSDHLVSDGVTAPPEQQVITTTPPSINFSQKGIEIDDNYDTSSTGYIDQLPGTEREELVQKADLSLGDSTVTFDLTAAIVAISKLFGQYEYYRIAGFKMTNSRAYNWLKSAKFLHVMYVRDPYRAAPPALDASFKDLRSHQWRHFKADDRMEWDVPVTQEWLYALTGVDTRKSNAGKVYFRASGVSSSLVTPPKFNFTYTAVIEYKVPTITGLSQPYVIYQNPLSFNKTSFYLVKNGEGNYNIRVDLSAIVLTTGQKFQVFTQVPIYLNGTVRTIKDEVELEYPFSEVISRLSLSTNSAGTKNYASWVTSSFDTFDLAMATDDTVLLEDINYSPGQFYVWYNAPIGTTVNLS